MLRIHGEPQQSADLLQRALYCFEVNAHPMFNPGAGQCRMDYRICENRAFFICLFKYERRWKEEEEGESVCVRVCMCVCLHLFTHEPMAACRHISSVAQRGCFRTALECTKLLLALDPNNVCDHPCTQA